MAAKGSPRRRTRFVAPGILVLIAPLSAGVLAQQATSAQADQQAAPGAGTPQASPGETVQEVVVTAQKRSQNIQDVPISMTALTGSTLEQLGAMDELGYVGQVPGLSFQSQGPTGDQHGNPVMSLRGIAATTGAYTVGFYINDTPMHYVDPSLFDISRIEVLLGPQGTLYGASSMGGTIRIITTEPDTNSWGGKWDGFLSETQHGGSNVDANVIFNVPILTDRVGFRISLFSRDDSGYIDNILRGPQNATSTVVPPPVNIEATDVLKGVNSQTVRGGRAELLIRATDQLTVSLSDMQQDLRVAGDPTYKVILNPSDPAFSFGTIAPIVNDFTQGALVTHDINPAPQEEKFDLYDVTIRYNPGPVSVVSSTSYYDRFTAGVIDMTEVLPFEFGMNVPVANNLDDLDSSHAFTEETRATANTGPLTWLVGIFYQNVYTQFQQSLVDVNFNDEVFGGADVVPNGIFLAFLSKDSEAQTAEFADLTYSITHALDLDVGWRYLKVDDTTSTVADGLFNGGPSQAFATAHSTGNTPKVSVSYKFTPDAMAYATVSKGFRPGFGLQPVGVACDPTLKALGLPAGGPLQANPDSLWNHEMGFKTSFLDQRLVINGAAYEIDWNNIQQNLNLGSCGYSTTINSGQARSEGFEMQISATPLPNLEFSASGSESHSYLTANASQVGAVNGDPVLNVARWHAAAALTYTLPVRPGYDGFAHADYQFTGPIYAGYDFSTPVFAYVDEQPSYYIVNLRTGVNHNSWEVALYMQNATNARPRISALNFITPDIQVYTIQPRTMGINVKETF
jgi:iron complex outermembrane recepter protein